MPRGPLFIRLFAIAVTAVTLPAHSAGHTPLPLHTADIEALVPQLEDTVRQAMDAWEVPGIAIGIVADDMLVYGKGFGVREQGTTAAVDIDTLFQIGSSTKAFLGLTLAQLVDDGKLDWHDKVADLHPGFRLKDSWVSGEFEIADLLAQRSGLPPSVLTSMMIYDYPEDDIIRALRHVSPATSFRSVFAYQNAFHLVAGQIVARLGGAPDWETFLTERVLQPLGMQDTHGTAQAMRDTENRAVGHGCNFGQAPCRKPIFAFPYNAHGAGGLNSSIRDLSQWLRLHINKGEIDGKRIVSKEALNATYMQRIAIPDDFMRMVGMNSRDRGGYATGWFLHSVPSGRVIEHCGATIGYMGCVAFDPDRKVGIVLQTNRLMEMDLGLASTLTLHIMSMLHGTHDDDFIASRQSRFSDQLKAHRQSLEAPEKAHPPRSLQDYVGKYHSTVLGDVEIRAHDDTLMFELGPRQLPVVLEPWSGDVFLSHVQLPVFEGEPATETRHLRFTTNAQDQIDGFDWSGQGDHLGQPPFHKRELADGN